MTINKSENGSAMTISLEGRLDTTTSPALEKELNEVLPKINELVFDFSKLACPAHRPQGNVPQRRNEGHQRQ